jgi:anaerobic selenocysteine-containing dehydrogenase
MPAGGGIIRSHVPESERSAIIQSLQSFGIAPGENDADAENSDYIVVARNDKGKLNNILQRHALQERSKHLLNFAEALPCFASSIAVSAYKDACSTLFGLKQTR